VLRRAVVREDERERKEGRDGDGAPFIGDAAGSGGQVTGGGCGASSVVGWRGVAVDDRWAPATVPGGSGLNTIQIQMNSNYFKTFQI
jgi:hypothetical protein